MTDTILLSGMITNAVMAVGFTACFVFFYLLNKRVEKLEGRND